MTCSLRIFSLIDSGVQALPRTAQMGDVKNSQYLCVFQAKIYAAHAPSGVRKIA